MKEVCAHFLSVSHFENKDERRNGIIFCWAAERYVEAKMLLFCVCGLRPRRNSVSF